MAAKNTAKKCKNIIRYFFTDLFIIYSAADYLLAHATYSCTNYTRRNFGRHPLLNG